MRSSGLITVVAASIAAVVVAQDGSPSGPTMSGTPSNCNAWYTVVSGDSCPGVEKKFGLTADQFFAWNPAVSRDCTTNFWVGESYCVGVGKKQTSSSTSRTASKTSTKTTTSSSSTKSVPYSTRHPITSWNITRPTSPTAWPPTKTQAGEPSSCYDWHYVVPGDTCQRIVNLYGNTLTLKDFMAWNPAVKADCSILLNGYYVCIAVKATTTSSFDWFHTSNKTVPSPTPWTPTVLPTINSSFTASPQQSGVPSSCQNFWKAAPNDSCKTALKAYPYITQDQFFKWNPAVGGKCDGIWAGYWYCVANFGHNNLPQPPTQTTAGTPTEDDTVSGCRAWYQAGYGDTCDTIAQAFGSFSKSNFISWNPSVSKDCGTIQGGYYYCVGIAGTLTTRTNTLTSPTTTASMPTQSGITASCNSYWFVSDDDTCKSVETAAGITDAQFTAWNSKVGSGDSCKLTPNTYVCIGVKG